MMKRQDGFMLIEILVAVTILAVGVLAVVGASISSNHLNSVAEGQTSMLHRAQRELERLEALPYSKVGMSGWPATSPDSSRPVSGSTCANGTFKYAPTMQAESVACGGVISPTPTHWQDSGRSGNIYDLVTWHADSVCNNGTNCDATQDYKRVTVMVTLDGAAHPSKPALVATMIADPNAAPNGYVVNGVQNPLQGADTKCVDGSGNQVACTSGLDTGSPDTYYLTDTSTISYNGLGVLTSYNDTDQPPTASHPTHPTIAPVNAALCSVLTSVASGCENPDLLSTTPPAGNPATPYCYSTDVACLAGGGRELKKDVSCSTAPSWTSTDEAHGGFWVTPVVSATDVTHLTGDAAMTLFAQNTNGVSADVTLCVAIYVVPQKLLSLITVPPVQIGATANVAITNLPASATPVSFNFNLNAASTALAVAAGNRLGVRVWVASASNVNLIYGHASYASQLVVNTK